MPVLFLLVKATFSGGGFLFFFRIGLDFSKSKCPVAPYDVLQIAPLGQGYPRT
jgi:hypothetical protein